MNPSTAFSLSLQREIRKSRLSMDSELNISMNNLGVRTLLNKAGITKKKGFTPITILFALIILPLIKESLAALWSGKYFATILDAQKDVYYRFINHPFFNWRKFVTLLAGRILAKQDDTPFNDKVFIVDDTLSHKTGKEMELVSYHFDHTNKRSQLGYQWLQLGYHNGTDFYPVDGAFHTSQRRPNETIRAIDHRSCGWKRRQEAFAKKTEVLLEMLRRCWKMDLSARFVLFDSWFAYDCIIAAIVAIGYGVICRLKRNRTTYAYRGQVFTLAQLWHTVARHKLQWVRSWQVMATTLEVSLPKAGLVTIVFVRWSRTQWHAFLCTERDLTVADILDYYARRWAIEVYFRDCKQLLGLGKEQSETFDAVVAWMSIVMIRYLLLVYILSLRQTKGPLGPLFHELAYEHLHLALIHSIWARLKDAVKLSRELFLPQNESESFYHILDLIEESAISL